MTVRTRQFEEVASKSHGQRVALVAEGLELLSSRVRALYAELQSCVAHEEKFAAELVYNIGYEEAGKYLVLIDAFRAPDVGQKLRKRQFRRAGDHLSKLVYAQIADYSIATRAELDRAVQMHRQELHLDGPNDGWVLPNQLISERELPMYVDLMEMEGELHWTSPLDDPLVSPTCRPMELVLGLAQTGLGTPDGLRLLEDAWRDFDHAADTHYDEWATRTKAALRTYAAGRAVDQRWNTAAATVVHLWPMPLVAVDIEKVHNDEADLVRLRDERFSEFLAREYGLDEFL